MKSKHETSDLNVNKLDDSIVKAKSSGECYQDHENVEIDGKNAQDLKLDSLEHQYFRENYYQYVKEKFELFKLYNGAVLAVSSAIIAGSIAITKTMGQENYVIFLKLGWVFLCLAIVASIIELHCSYEYYVALVEHIASTRSYPGKTFRYNLCRILIWVTTSSLVVGIILVLIYFCSTGSGSFVRTNSNGETVMTEERPLQKSLPSPPPPRPETNPQAPGAVNMPHSERPAIQEKGSITPQGK